MPLVERNKNDERVREYNRRGDNAENTAKKMLDELKRCRDRWR